MDLSLNADTLLARFSCLSREGVRGGDSPWPSYGRVRCRSMCTRRWDGRSGCRDRSARRAWCRRCFWSGYWRHVGRREWSGRSSFRGPGAGCAATHALLPGFVLARRVDEVGTVGAVTEQVAAVRAGSAGGGAGRGAAHDGARLGASTGPAGDPVGGRASGALAVELGGEAIEPGDDPQAWAFAAIRAAFRAATALPGWAALGRWRFACCVSGGQLLAANTTSPYLMVGKRRFLPPAPAPGAETEDEMDRDQQEQVALHRWAVIAEAANARLSPAERGVAVRAAAARTRTHTHPDGTTRRYSRGTIDRWVRAWRAGGLAALRPAPRSDAGAVRAHPELADEAAALRLELPTRSAAQIASILFHRHGVQVAERTVRQQLRRRGLHRAALVAAAEPAAVTRPNGPTNGGSPTCSSARGCRTGTGRRARLFLIVDDHSRLLVDGRFFAHENARAGQETLRRAITRRGLPDVLYADNGAPFANAWLARTCAVLGIRLVHSRPYSPQGRGKQERQPLHPGGVPGRGHPPGHRVPRRAQRPVRGAWAEQGAYRRVHAETGQAPIERFEAGGPHRADADRAAARRSAGQ